MCGICGFSPSIGVETDKVIIEKMKAYLYHRGPDDDGEYFSWHCVLGHQRLSIIDLESGHQPMCNEDWEIWVVFNGEIYNYKELWKELEAKGHKFISDHADTEVIVHGYEEWGTDLFKKLNGIFAIAIWDEKKNNLILARDHIGVKPLYYACDGKRLVFAAEPKAVIAHPEVKNEFDAGQIANYFFFRAPVHPRTFFKDVYKIAPGSFFVWNPGTKQVKQTVYWQPGIPAQQYQNEKEVIARVEELLEDSVRKQLVSDVPLGVFLSGGVDSGLVAAAMAKQHFTSEGFVVAAGKDNEAKWSQQVANHLRIKNNVLEVTGGDFLKFFSHWAYVNDDPVSDPSALALLLIANFAKEKGRTVMLTGEGADELFAGYNAYLRFLTYDRLKSIPLACGIMRGLLRVAGKGNYRDNDYRLISSKGWGFLGTGHTCSFDLLRRVILADMNPIDTVLGVMNSYGEKEGDPLDQACLFDQRVRLPDDLLARTDRASMAVSLEARVPLLDYRLIELANSIPQKLKVRRNCLKYILKHIAVKQIPRSVVYRKKMGFDLPLEKWLRGEFAERLRRYSIKNKIPGIEYKVIKRLINGYLSGRNNEYTDFIWSYLLLEQWYELWCGTVLPEPQVMP